MRKSIVQEKSFLFASKIIKFCEFRKCEYSKVIPSQLLRSGTSIGANISEALEGQSKRDFIHKMSIALKESKEANYWLRLIKADRPEIKELDELLELSEELNRIITKILLTSKYGKK